MDSTESRERRILTALAGLVALSSTWARKEGPLAVARWNEVHLISAMNADVEVFEAACAHLCKTWTSEYQPPNPGHILAARSAILSEPKWDKPALPMPEPLTPGQGQELVEAALRDGTGPFWDERRRRRGEGG